MSRVLSLTAVMALCTLASCGGSTTDPGEKGGGGGGKDPSGVTVSDNRFEPAELTVGKGTTVTWTWAEGSSGHTVTFDDGPTSDKLSSGTYSRTFNGTGSFPYHCKVHGLSMSGTITVK